MADGRDDDGPDDGSFSIYMLRTMQQHHVHLSTQADQKASMLIGATAVIMTLIFRDANAPAGVPLPLICVAGASFVAAVLAILAVTPLTKPKPHSNANLMFFGAFLGLDEEAYQDRMATIMASTAGFSAPWCATSISSARCSGSGNSGWSPGRTGCSWSAWSAASRYSWSGC